MDELENLKEELTRLQRQHDFFVALAVRALARLKLEHDRDARDLITDLKSYIFARLFQ